MAASMALTSVAMDPLERAELKPVAAWRAFDVRRGGGASDWPEGEEREELLTGLATDQYDEDRLQTLVALQGLAAGHQREAFWRDGELRDALLACVPETEASQAWLAEEQPQPLRVVALGVILRALASAEIQMAILSDAEVRKSLLDACTRDQGDDVCARACHILAILLVAATRSESAADTQDLYKAFAGVAAAGQPDEQRVQLLGALWSAASSERADLEEMWESAFLREPLLASAAEEEAPEVRAAALGALWALAGDAAVDRARVWENDAAAKAIIAGASIDERTDVREVALGALANCAAAEELRASLWLDAGEVVVAAAMPGEPTVVRETALRTLVRLTCEEANQQLMAEASAHLVLYEAVEDPTIPRVAKPYYRGAHRRVAPFSQEAHVLAMLGQLFGEFLSPGNTSDEPEYLQPVGLQFRLGARVRHRSAGDGRLGKVEAVHVGEDGAVCASIRWSDAMFQPLRAGQLAYAEATKQGDPIEVPIVDELVGIQVTALDRIGTVVRAVRAEFGSLEVAVRWDVQGYDEGHLFELEYLKSWNLRLTSFSVATCPLLPPPPAELVETPPPKEEAEAAVLPPPERLMGRTEIPEDEYGAYAEKMMKDHGGPLGAVVLYIDELPFCGIRLGMEGTIVRYDHLDMFQVNWTGYERKFVTMRRCMLVETSDHSFRWTEQVPEPDYCGGGGCSGPDFARAADFPGAVVPQTCPFTLCTKIRTTVKGSKQHFLGWGTGNNRSKRSVDFRLTEAGNLEYGEHDGSLGSGWRAVECRPPLNLADGAWHGVSISRHVPGDVAIYCDGELIGQGAISANVPWPGLVPGAKAARRSKRDSVFCGDVAPLRIFHSALSIGQIRAVEVLSSTAPADPAAEEAGQETQPGTEPAIAAEEQTEEDQESTEHGEMPAAMPADGGQAALSDTVSGITVEVGGEEGAEHEQVAYSTQGEQTPQMAE